MSAAQEIEEAIRGLPPAERDKLLRHIPRLFREFAGDEEWNRITDDARPRPALSDLLNGYEGELNEFDRRFPA